MSLLTLRVLSPTGGSRSLTRRLMVISRTLAGAGRVGVGSAIVLTTMLGLARAGDTGLGGEGSVAVSANSAAPGTSDTGLAAAAGVNPSAAQISQAKAVVSQGGPSPAQMQQLCAGVAAKHITADDVQSAGASLGLSADQINQLKSCAGGAPAASGKGGGGEAAAGAKATAAAAQPPAAAPGELSSIEQTFHGLANPAGKTLPPLPIDLQQFGYALFSSPVSTFAPVTNVPVGPDYILGPGDGLNVLMWGRVNRTLQLNVERDGSVLVPEIGPVEVAGLTFDQAKKLIESRTGQITGVQVDVTMGAIRTIQVFVIGKVNHPGLYTVSALSHVSNVLVAAGGISKIGSLRRVELKRHGQLIRTIDLYDMLLHGDTSADLRVEQGDVIFDPVIGPVVGVAGDIKDPAIYELKDSENLNKVLRMAGGVGAFGYGRRLQVERIENHEQRIALDIELSNLAYRRFQVRDGDLIKVFTVLPQQRNIVTLKGNVNRPGAYQWYPGMTVATLVREGEGPADNTFFGYALIKRIEGPDQRVRFLPVRLGEALDNGALFTADLALKPRDTLTIYNERDLGELPQVSVVGGVRKPGTYPLTEDMKVSDLIYEAGGLKDNAYLPRAEIARTTVVDGTARYIYQDVDLEQALSDVAGGNPALSRGDMLFIQTASNWHRPSVVLVEGEVLRPGPYAVHEGERLASVIERAGGLRPDAYLPASVFIRQSVQQIEQQRLNEGRARLQEEAARLALAPPQPGQQSNNTAALTTIQQVLASTESQQAVGRVVLHLTTLTTLANSPDDIALENSDRFTIPRRPASINVLGQVYTPTSIVYKPGLTVRDYLEKAGGPTEGADEDHIFVITANGSVLTEAGIKNSEKNMLFPLLPVIGGGLMATKLGPGDTVYVPEKLLYVSGLQYATAVTQIIANSAMALAVVGILGTSI